jgi:hypothetical protein
LKLVLSPRRAGNFLHDAFVTFRRSNRSKSESGGFYRLLGIMLLVVWAGGMYSAYSRVVTLIRGL